MSEFAPTPDERAADEAISAIEDAQHYARLAQEVLEPAAWSSTPLADDALEQAMSMLGSAEDLIRSAQDALAARAQQKRRGGAAAAGFWRDKPA